MDSRLLSDEVITRLRFNLGEGGCWYTMTPSVMTADLLASHDALAAQVAGLQRVVAAAVEFRDAVIADIDAQGVFYATLADEQSARHIPTNAATLHTTGAAASDAEAKFADALAALSDSAPATDAPSDVKITLVNPDYDFSQMHASISNGAPEPAAIDLLRVRFQQHNSLRFAETKTETSYRKLGMEIGVDHCALQRFDHGKGISHENAKKIEAWLLQPPASQTEGACWNCGGMESETCITCNGTGTAPATAEEQGKVDADG